jgi:hypothetical protein
VCRNLEQVWQTLNKIPDEVRRHCAGSRFKRLKEQKERNPGKTEEAEDSDEEFPFTEFVEEKEIEHSGAVHVRATPPDDAGSERKHSTAVVPKRSSHGAERAQPAPELRHHPKVHVRPRSKNGWKKAAPPPKRPKLRIVD